MGGENMNSLTKAQQELVAQNLPVVHWVICDVYQTTPYDLTEIRGIHEE